MASPLGLATRLGEAAAEGDDETSGSGPADFLSSIEVAVVARADVMSMQNWAHVKLGATLPWQHKLRRPRSGGDMADSDAPTDVMLRCIGSCCESYNNKASARS